MLGLTDIGGIPDPEDATWWFLINVVGIPGAAVAILVSLAAIAAWIKAARGLARYGARVAAGSSTAIRSRRWSTLACTVLAQTGLVAMSYVLGQICQVIPKWPTGVSLADGKAAWDTSDVITAAFDYNNWTPISLRVVQGALLFLLVSNISSLFDLAVEVILTLLLGVAALALAASMAIGGIVVLILGLQHSGYYTPGMAGLLAVYAGLLVLWVLLLWWSINLQSGFNGLLRPAKP